MKTKSCSMKISVIIPMYGVEKYIARCAKSLFEQTLVDGVEFIFIDDASKDKSREVLETVIHEYSAKGLNVKVVTHDKNKGLPSARNTGLKYAVGEYVIHIDGDDYLEKDALEVLYGAVEKNNADVAWCDYYITFEHKKRIIAQPDFSTPEDAVRGMLRGTMKYNVWNKLCRRSLYSENDIQFPDGKSMGEDLTMIMVFLHARNCVYVNRALYNYVQNPDQMTATYNEEKLDALRHNCYRLSQYIDENFAHIDYRREYSALKQLMKWPFLLDGKYSSYKRWHQWFPESNAFIWQTEGVNKRIKLIEWCAAKHLLPIVWLHYILVIKLYYGIVYK